jgi:uncharacterized protein
VNEDPALGSRFTQVRRLPEKARTDRSVLDHILDTGLVAHVGVSDGNQPVVIPVAFARLHDDLVIHGSTASRLFTLLRSGAPAAVTITLEDGIVLARSLFESSMNYRCAMLFGTFRNAHGQTEIDGLRAITEKLMPGRWQDARKPTTQELKATATLLMPINTWSVKISEGDPEDSPKDLASRDSMEIWAGVIPLRRMYGTPVTDPLVPTHVSIPRYITAQIEQQNE